jgi:CubicO group peptidase (beta-lactamase class C family)
MSFQQLKDTLSAIATRLIRGDIASIKRLMDVNTLFHPDKIHHNFTHIKDLFFHQKLNAGNATPSPIAYVPKELPSSVSVDGVPRSLDVWKQERAISAFIVIKDNKILHEDYAHGTSETDLRMSWSMCKSMLSLLVGALIDKGLMHRDNLDQRVSDHVPSLLGTGYETVTLRNTLNMASGVEFNEDYLDYNSDINKMGRLLALGGSIDEFSTSLGPLWKPGQYSHYVSIDTQVIGMVVRAVTQTDLASLLEAHIIQPLGLEQDPIMVTDQSGELFILGGMNMRTRDYARVGLMVLNKGFWNGTQIVSKDWIEESTTQSAPLPSPIKMETADRVLRYGYQWWIPPHASHGECFAIGVYGQYIYINPSQNVVIAMNSGDVNFKDGSGRITQENIDVFRQIALGVQD